MPDKITEEMGTDGKPLGEGGTDICICPKCKTEVKHKRGIPCIKLKCPVCGGQMAGKSRPQTAIKKEEVFGMEITEVVERIISSDTRVDKENGIIHDFLILGAESKNGYRYRDKAMSKGAPLYEGKKVYFGHKDGHREVKELAGIIRNPRYTQDNKIKGDLHISSKESWLLDDAIRIPEMIGASHHIGNVRMSNEGGHKFIEDFKEVESVDLVTEPATTRSMFENVNKNIEGGDEEMKLEELTIKELREKRSDLVDEIVEETKNKGDLKVESDKLKEENKTLKEDLDKYKLAEERQTREEKVAKLLKEKKVPDVVVSDLFKERLITEEDETKIGELIDDRLSVWKGETKPISREKTNTEETKVTDEDREEVKEAIKR